MTQRNQSILVNVVLCFVVLAMGGGIFSGLAAMKEPPATKAPTTQTFNVNVFRVEKSDLQEIITGFGTVVADQDVPYAAQVTGEITYMRKNLKVGEKVNALAKSESDDDPLLTIDPDIYIERREQAENAFDEANAQLELLSQRNENNEKLLSHAIEDEADAKKQYERVRQNFRDGAATESALTQAQLDYRRFQSARQKLENEKAIFPLQEASLKKQILSLNSQLKLARIDEARTRIHAPFSGVLSEVHVEKGQLVQPGTPLFRVTNLDIVEIAVPLHALDAAKINELLKAGQEPLVRIAVNETTKPQWVGRVTRISPKAHENSRTIDVFVEVENSEESVPLLPGTFVQVRIEGPLLQNTIAIPRDAVIGGSSESGRVFVVEDKRTMAREVKLSRRLEGMAFVTDGIETGERILLTNLDVVENGSAVAVQIERTLLGELANQQTLQTMTPSQ